MNKAKLFKLALDVLFLAGLGILAFGVWMAWRPGGVMAAGALLAAFAFLLGYGSRSRTE